MKKLPKGQMGRYDWSRATRGTLAKRIAAERSNLRALDDAVAEYFVDSAAVNAALRAVLAIRGAPPGRGPKTRSRRAA